MRHSHTASAPVGGQKYYLGAEAPAVLSSSIAADAPQGYCCNNVTSLSLVAPGLFFALSPLGSASAPGVWCGAMQAGEEWESSLSKESWQRATGKDIGVCGCYIDWTGGI